MTEQENRFENIEKAQLAQLRATESLRQDVDSLRQDVLAIRQDLAEHRKSENNTADLVIALTKLVEKLGEKEAGK